jgi:molecular chaperone GrpE (heat shock protein)
MLQLFKRLFQRRQGNPAATREEVLAAQRETQALRLELQERDRLIAALKGDLDRLRRGDSDRIATAVAAERERLLTDAAAPAAQLLTQAHLLEVEGKPVQARDVLAVARRLLRLLEDEGLTAAGRIGETVPFDPNRHEPLGGEVSLTPGQPAIVRLVGMSLRGKILRKAGVAPL